MASASHVNCVFCFSYVLNIIDSACKGIYCVMGLVNKFASDFIGIFSIGYCGCCYHMWAGFASGSTTRLATSEDLISLQV